MKYILEQNVKESNATVQSWYGVLALELINFVDEL